MRPLPRRIPTGAVLGVGLLLAAGLSAQPKPPFVSPECHDDGSVTLRVHAPRAQAVSVTGRLSKAVTTTRKTDDGLWELTTGPLEPDIYEYAFDVDGTRTLDSQNPWIKYWKTSDNLVEVRGETPTAWEERDVPHGEVRVVRYRSRSLGCSRRLHVYTPPGYEDGGDTRYPTLYLLHGFGDDDSMWTHLGRAHFIADNAIADGKALPMLIVMPYGHARFGAPGRPEGVPDDPRQENLHAVTTDLLRDVVPLVERRFRARSDAAGRAIVGLSMGGGQSLHVGLNHPETFAWVGAFSSAVYAEDFGAAFPIARDDAARLDRELRWLWIACGRDDFLLKTDQRFSGWLEERGVRHELLLTDGGHSWSVWRNDYLPRVLPQLFREPAEGTGDR